MNKAELETLIKDAFRGVHLGKGCSLRDAETADNWGKSGLDQDLVSFPDVETKDDCSSLSLRTLDRYPYLAHMDAEGLRYYIPAFMLSILADDNYSSMRFICTLSALYPSRKEANLERWNYHVGLYSLLDGEQRSAITAFLDALPVLAKIDPGDVKSIERALRNYWHQFLLVS